MALTLTEVQTSLTKWKAAYDAVSRGETFMMNGRTLTRTDADTCWAQIVRLSRTEKKLQEAASAGHNRLLGGAKVARFK